MPSLFDVEVTYLFNARHTREFLEFEQAYLPNSYVGIKPDVGSHTKTVQVVTHYVKEFPPIVRVNGDLWHSLDLHSRDMYALIFDFKGVHLEDDHLEALADSDGVVEAITVLFYENPTRWIYTLRALNRLS